MKIAFFRDLIARSGLPGKSLTFTRKRKPRAYAVRRTTSSGFVSRDLTARMTSERFSRETLSISIACYWGPFRRRSSCIASTQALSSPRVHGRILSRRLCAAFKYFARFQSMNSETRSRNSFANRLTSSWLLTRIEGRRSICPLLYIE